MVRVAKNKNLCYGCSSYFCDKHRNYDHKNFGIGHLCLSKYACNQYYVPAILGSILAVGVGLMMVGIPLTYHYEKEGKKYTIYKLQSGEIAICKYKDGGSGGVHLSNCLGPIENYLSQINMKDLGEVKTTGWRP